MVLLLKFLMMEEILNYFPDLTEIQKAQFEKLDFLYHDWNAKINVISRKDIDELYTKHVLHWELLKLFNSNLVVLCLT
jgi:16S rRNA (guanine527-N7)-methyltransferase